MLKYFYLSKYGIKILIHINEEDFFLNRDNLGLQERVKLNFAFR